LRKIITEEEKMKKLLALCLVGVLSLSVLTGCASNGDEKKEAVITTETEAVEENAAVVDSTVAKDVVKNPKYVFLFIGDGMTYPQFQATASYPWCSKRNR
jgi:alkaline phosphatase